MMTYERPQAMLFYFKTPLRKHGAAFAVIVVLLHFGFVLWMNLMYTAYPIHSRGHTPAYMPPVPAPETMTMQQQPQEQPQGVQLTPQMRKH